MFIMLLLLERTADTACISINNHIVCCYIHSKLNNIYHKIIYSFFLNMRQLIKSTLNCLGLKTK